MGKIPICFHEWPEAENVGHNVQGEKLQKIQQIEKSLKQKFPGKEIEGSGYRDQLSGPPVTSCST